jgi:hypothetical protein
MSWSGFGVVLCYIICHPCYCCGYVDPISVENRIWSDGNGIVGVMLTVQGLSGAMLEACG